MGRCVELLNGEIVEMAPEGEFHAYSSDEAGEYLIYLLGERAKVRQGKPITLPQSNSEPEPDIAIVERLGRDYREHHPWPAWNGQKPPDTYPVTRPCYRK